MRAAKSGIGGEISTRAAASTPATGPAIVRTTSQTAAVPQAASSAIPSLMRSALIAERRRDRPQDPVEGRRLRREDVRPQMLPRAEGRDRGDRHPRRSRAPSRGAG